MEVCRGANPLTPGTILSRIGIWSFDLCQLKLLQISLDDHPYRNRLAALQLALQNSFNLLKFTLTMVASRPQKLQVDGAGIVSGGDHWRCLLCGVSTDSAPMMISSSRGRRRKPCKFDLLREHKRGYPRAKCYACLRGVKG
jgi:hypothetical protein